MELSIVQQWKKSIHGEAQGASPDGHYLQLLSLTPQEFLDKDYGDEYAAGLADGSITMELVNTYECGDYDLALPMTSYLRVFQRAWKNKHRHIKLARENRMTCLSELRSYQLEEDKGYPSTYKFVLCRIDGMPVLVSEEEEEEEDYSTDSEEDDNNPNYNPNYNYKPNNNESNYIYAKY